MSNYFFRKIKQALVALVTKTFINKEQNLRYWSRSF